MRRSTNNYKTPFDIMINAASLVLAISSVINKYLSGIVVYGNFGQCWVTGLVVGSKAMPTLLLTSSYNACQLTPSRILQPITDALMRLHQLLSVILSKDFFLSNISIIDSAFFPYSWNIYMNFTVLRKLVIIDPHICM
jgi:hypothetical protein